MEMKAKLNFDAEEKLKEFGFSFERQSTVKDTYFKNETGILKVTEDKGKLVLTNFIKTSSGFESDSTEIDSSIKKEIEKEFKADAVLEKGMKFYKKENLTAQINIIPGLGKYLTVQGREDEVKKVFEFLKINKFELKGFNELIKFQ